MRPLRVILEQYFVRIARQQLPPLGAWLLERRKLVVRATARSPEPSRRCNGSNSESEKTPEKLLSCHVPSSDRPGYLYKPGFPFCPPNQGFYTPTRLSAHQISSSHIVPLPAEAAVDVEPTHASAFRAFLRHRSTLMLFLRRSSAVSGRPLSSLLRPRVFLDT